MNKKKYINDTDLDEFLKAYSLNKTTDNERDALAKTIFNKDYDVQINANKEKELLFKLAANNKKGFNKIWGVLTLIVLISIGSLLLLYTTPKSDQTQKIINPVAFKDKTSRKSALTEVHIVHPEIIDNYFTQTNKIVELDLIYDTNQNQKQLISAEKFVTKKIQKKTQSLDKHLKRYLKLKPNIIKLALSTDTNIYTKVRGNSISYKKQKKGVDAFVMRRFSVTNMEYKTFLADLIRQNNKKGFSEAQVKQNVWEDYNCNSLALDYFTNDKYDGFPVVNISPTAMLLYCKWLENETNKYLKLNKKKARPIILRLPYDYEWISATQIGSAYIPQCEGYQTIFDLSEALINKSFIRRIKKHQNKKRYKKKTYDEWLEKNRYGWTENELLTAFEVVKAVSISPYPSNLQTIGKVAHVSECVQNIAGEIIVFGSCWSSKSTYKQMLNEFNAKKASPFVGFRYIIINEETNTYKNPFW